jgi:hypothetical protein
MPLIQTNYTPDWLQQLDKRTAIAQELRARYDALTNDLGGLPSLSYQQRSLIDRSLFLEYHLQEEERKLATGGEFDSGKWVQAVNALQGIYSKLGLKRVKTELSLDQYIKQAGLV